MINNISSKLSLGTVQFGIEYGVNNTNGIPDDSGLKDILNLAHTAGIDILDCAPGYGISEKRIGLNALGRFKIITKFSNVESEANFKTALQSSLETLRIKQAYGYIAHNCDELIANPETWQWLQNAKNEGKIQKAGFSLYHPEQLERLMELNMIPDLVQLPYNLLDKKFDSYLTKLKYFGTEIHVRSVFLQGLFFMDIEKIKLNLKPLVPQLKELKEICVRYNVSMSELALGFVHNNPLVDKIVIGVENASQLLKNIDDVNGVRIDKAVMEEVCAINVEMKSLLNPATW